VEPFREDMKRHLELGLEAEALEICKGLLLGCYRLSGRAGGDVLGWAPDFPAEAAGHALEVWYFGTDGSQDARRAGNSVLRLRRSFSIWFPSGYP
jgi:hypothetical protein